MLVALNSQSSTDARPGQGADDRGQHDHAPAQRLMAARIAAVLDLMLFVVLANIITAGLLALVVRQSANTLVHDLWFGTIVLLSLFRLLLYWHYRRDADRAHHNHRWRAVTVGGSLLSGIIWGAGALWLLPDATASQWTWSLAVAGMCAGAVALHSAHLPTALCFTLPASLPLLGRVTLGADRVALLTSTLIVTFVVFTTLIAVKLSRDFGRTFFLKLAMEDQAEALNRVNRQLTSEVADHQKTNEILGQARKMEAIGRLTSGVAHDFNNLLSVILTNLELARTRTDDGDVRRHLDNALDAVHSGADLTASLIAFARKQSLRPVAADLNSLIERAMPLLVQAAGSGVTISFAPLERQLRVRVDATQLQVALLNLVINARDAMGGQGHVVLSTHPRRFDRATRKRTGTQLPQGDYVLLEVRDDGPGIGENIVDKVFEPFFTTKGVGHGSGLGLSQVFGFVTQSGGGVDLRTAAGSGTAFLLYLPLYDGPLQQAPAAEAVDHSEAPAQQGRVVIVDDNQSVLEGLHDVLVSEGWHVDAVGSGERAIDVLSDTADAQALLTDLDMPGMSGRELIAIVRKRWPDVRVIAMSGSPPDDMDHDTEFLNKPFTSAQLLAAVRGASTDAVRPHRAGMAVDGKASTRPRTVS